VLEVKREDFERKKNIFTLGIKKDQSNFLRRRRRVKGARVILAFYI
jgi:hypothetical protein